MPILFDNGSTAMIIGTEITLFQSVDSKRFDGYIDLTNLASGDTLEIRVYVQINTLGAFVQYWVETLTDSQSPNYLLYLPTLPTDIGYKVTAKQTAGSAAKTLDWRIYEVP